MKKSFQVGLAITFCLLAALGFLIQARLDLAAPGLAVSPQLTSLGARTVLSLTVTDEGAGLKAVEVSLTQDGRQAVPLKIDYPERGLLEGTGVNHQDLEVVLEPRKLGLAQGPAELRFKVRDASWWHMFEGNETQLRQTVQIDWQPPGLQVLSSAHNLRRGGTGLILYRLEEEAASGVRVADRFFPGYPCSLGEGVKCCYFAYPVELEEPPGDLVVVARDAAGNETRAGFYHRLRNRRFPEDSVEISEQFMANVVGRLLPAASSGQPAAARFLEVNRSLRAANHQSIRETCATSSPEQLWKGAFARPRNTAPMAGFGDRRTYLLGGREVDRQRHLGVDLASVTAAPVQAANGGLVAFANELGIYGNCVIIDHGQGLFSLYGHLSQITVSAGEKVRSGQLIGRTGSTGLAGGDHLHFAMLVSGTFVDPVEWWDAHWIKDNIELKFAQAKELLAPPPPLPGPGARDTETIR